MGTRLLPKELQANIVYSTATPSNAKERQAAASDGGRLHPGCSRIGRCATNQVRAISVGLQAHGPGAIYFELQRLIVGRAEKIRTGD